MGFPSFSHLDQKTKERVVVASYFKKIVVYVTQDRDGAEEEWRSLSDSLPDFQVQPIRRPDLTADEMLWAIREAATETDDVSALVVFIMAHGATGIVWGRDDTPLRIQDILIAMNEPALNGKPKVC